MQRISGDLLVFLHDLPVRRCLVICSSTQSIQDFLDALEIQTHQAGDVFVLEGGGCLESWAPTPRYERDEGLFDADGNMKPAALERLLSVERPAESIIRYVSTFSAGQPPGDILERQAMAQHRARNEPLAFFTLVCMPVKPALLAALLTSYPAVVIDSAVYTALDFTQQEGSALRRVARSGTLLAGFVELHRLVRKNHFMEGLLNSLDAPVLAGYIDGTIMGANESFLRLVGFSRREISVQNWTLDLAGPGFRALQEEVFTALVLTGRKQELYTELLTSGGTCVPSLVELSLHEDENAKPAFFSALYRPVTEIPSLGEAGKDRGDIIEDRLRIALSRSKREAGYSFAVLHMGVDNMDRVPLQAADEVKFSDMLARRIVNCLRAQDISANLDTERFAILLDNVADVIEAVRVAQRIQEETGRAFRIGRHDLHVTCSFGVVLGPGEYSGVAEILRDAQLALQRAMQRGGCQVVVFDEYQNSRAVQFFQIERSLRNALLENEVSLHFQPIQNLSTGSFCGAEAFMRWNYRREGLLRAEWFLPFAEHSDVFMDLEAWAIRRAFSALRHLQQNAGKSFFLGLNVSLKNVLRLGFLEEVLDVADEHGLDPSSVHLELREEWVKHFADRFGHVFDSVNQAGLGLVLDHFSAAHVSLADLHRLPLRGLKLEVSVQDNPTLLMSLLSVARSKGLALIATGVEDRGLLDRLHGIGCTHAQGNAVAPDMDEGALVNFLRDHS